MNDQDAKIEVVYDHDQIQENHVVMVNGVDIARFSKEKAERVAENLKKGMSVSDIEAVVEK